MRKNMSFHFYALITIFFWSLAYVLTRLTIRHFSAFSLGFLRYFIASATLLVFVFFKGTRLPGKKDLPWFFITGAFGFFLYMITFNKGCETVTASTASVIIATVPVMTALLSRCLYDEEITFLQWIAMGIEFSGVLLLTLMNGIFSINPGLIWLFAAAFALSMYNVLQKKLSSAYSGFEISAFSIFAGTIMLSLFSFDAIRELGQASLTQFCYVGFLGVFSSALAYVAWSQAIVRAKGVSSVSNYMFLTPFLTSILGFMMAKEKPDSATLAGGAIILLGLLLFIFEKRLRRIGFYKNFLSDNFETKKSSDL